MSLLVVTTMMLILFFTVLPSAEPGLHQGVVKGGIELSLHHPLLSLIACKVLSNQHALKNSDPSVLGSGALTLKDTAPIHWNHTRLRINIHLTSPIPPPPMPPSAV
ncbi:hypothetical protein EDC04DRAFT_2603163 [Pisolithus marmoratus]|nr:hypothetical protein EDC04DRAFT_2603163 [Pisolithus marmoratus]